MAETKILPSALRRIKAIALDVDGVLTDGGMWWGANGEEFKRFSFADIMGISLARRMGLTVALISGEASPLVDRYAEKMNITDVTKGCRDKATALRDFARRNALDLADVCFMGDDINDLEAMKLSGFSAAPADAQPEVLAQAGFQSTCKGGHGAVRELVNAIIGSHELDATQVWQRRV
jgi:3-deoxy-D-manno-octulosonate 8-phosphate phosphatase (KDO 8-P phosphatase)